MKPKIVIRADGGTSIGMGHVIRCLALADMLKNDFTIVFAIQMPVESVIKSIHTITETILHLPITNNYSQDASNFCGFLEETDIVILDGYNFKTDYQKAIKDKGCKLVAIDDLHAWHHVADVIINHAAGVDPAKYSAEKYTQFCLGLDYVLLRKAFLTNSSEEKEVNTIKKVFISMGAADVTNLTQKYTEALIQVNGIEEIHLMLGSINSNLTSIEKLIEKTKVPKIIKHFDISAEQLVKLLQQCDLAICPASSISLEACATGIALVSGYTAENQKGILKGLASKNVIINWNNLNKISADTIVTSLNELSKHSGKLNQIIENQKSVVDGKSPKRLLDVFKKLILEKIHFRLANENDVNLYFKWANDPFVRNNSYNQNEVVYENHIKWFKSKLDSKTCHFYLFFNEENAPVGQVRIDKNEKEVVIGISIDELHRGKKLAYRMLLSSSNDYLQKHPQETITAYIKIENKSSYQSFIKAGFGNEKLISEQGFNSYKLIKK